MDQLCFFKPAWLRESYVSLHLAADWRNFSDYSKYFGICKQNNILRFLQSRAKLVALLKRNHSISVPKQICDTFVLSGCLSRIKLLYYFSYSSRHQIACFKVKEAVHPTLPRGSKLTVCCF
jgi:hypothetical protein